ncbi:MAG: EamA family transporter [bacterium]|nr:EamA family transporter [bacterium]
MPTYLIVTLAITVGALGNFLIKIGSKHLPTTGLNGETILKIITNGPLLLGIALLIVSFPFYSMALQRLNLSVAFPLIQNVTFAILLVLSYFFLKESLTFINFLGIVLIMVGLVLAAR